jgi:gliding motility-associated-like protein
VPNISPNVDSLQTNVVPVDTVKVNGMDYYAFTLNGTFIFDTAGIIRIPIKYMSPNIERCDMTQEGFIVVQILPSPTTDFDVAFGGNGLACAGVTATFTGHEITSNGIAISQWNWTFPDGSTPSGRIQNYTYPNGGIYPVKLTGITADGCISDITKEIEINPNPEVVIAQEPVCEGSDAVFTVQNPDPSSIYNWYEVPGGAPIATGTSFTATNVTTGSTWYVMQVSAAGCNSALTQVTPAVQSPLPNPVVRVDTIGVDMVRFAWNAVPDAAGYQVSTDGGANWSTPSSGPSGLTHTMTGLTPLQTVTIIVKAVGCDESISAPVSAQLLPDGIYIPNAFTPNGDGLNDVLQVYSYKIKEMTFMVFNQWGEKIYESRTPNVAWDGTYKGKPQPSGVYVYVARMVLTDGTVVQRKGSINLIR